MQYTNLSHEINALLDTYVKLRNVKTRARDLIALEIVSRLEKVYVGKNI